MMMMGMTVHMMAALMRFCGRSWSTSLDHDVELPAPEGGIRVDVPEHVLQGPHGLLPDEDQDREPHVPVVHGAEDGERHDRGQDQGDDDAEEDGELVGPVELPALDHLLGQAGDDVAEHDGVEDPREIGEDQRQKGVVQAVPVHHEVEGDQAAGEVHGDQDVDEGHARAVEVPARQGVARAQGDPDAEWRVDEHDRQGVAEAREEEPARQDELVALRVELHGPEVHLARVERLLARQRHRDDVEEGQDDGQAEEREADVEEHLEDPPRDRAVHHHGVASLTTTRGRRLWRPPCSP